MAVAQDCDDEACVEFHEKVKGAPHGHEWSEIEFGSARAGERCMY
jgi:hypothetical protein